ncbi:ParB N-terminal domain-containing protein [Streptomyces sp. SBT349]|uniref:ParB N-terminal domain-containing protein n=1 Tax=Streptomyces sp. SBT349 TaxID=1580539 RepID=UPI00066A6642|nr:ParB N-terminal domain-containing protein [Streptomyces sp. SBT349]
MSDDREYFRFLTYQWDVTRAQEIAAGRPVHYFDPRSWFGWLGAVRINEEHVADADLTRPLIVVKIKEAGGDPLIIDGWHRLARAARENVTRLPVVVLDETQEFQARVFGGAKGRPPFSR